MTAKDLTREAPRRWSERIDGIAWLPRLIDKARAFHAGTLGAYLFGQSPMDHRCLRVLGLGHNSFLAIVADSPDDRAVLDRIVERDPQAIERGRAWSRGFALRNGPFLFVLDWDDGYAHPSLRVARPAVTAACNVVSNAAKRLFPGRVKPPSSTNAAGR
jgi:hypothetical protein